MNNKKRYFQIALIVLLVIGWGAGAFLLYKINIERAQSQVNIDTAQNEIGSLQKSNEELIDENKLLKEQNVELNTNLSEINIELENVISEKDKLKEEKINQLELYREQSVSLNNLKKRAECSDHWDFSYSSNSSMSAQLKKFVGEFRGSAENATWDVVWNNSSTAIHYVYTKDYLLAFVVSYEKDFTAVNSVFWLDNMCFISPE